MRAHTILPILLVTFTLALASKVKLHQFITTIVVTYDIEPTPVPVLDERDLSTVSTLTTTKTFNVRTTATLTKTVVVDNPMPTVTYYCRQMDQICENTRRTTINNRVTWLYDNEQDIKYDSNARRRAACGSISSQCKILNQCDTAIQDPMDWRMSCDEAPPASFLNGGPDADAICASFREQEAQRRILNVVPNLKSGDGHFYKDSYKLNRVYPVVFELDYGAHSSSLYGAVAARGATLVGTAGARTEITGPGVQGRTSTKGAFPISGTKAFAWGYGKTVTCKPQATCARARFAEIQEPLYLQPSDPSRPTPAPAVSRPVALAAASSTCTSKSPRDRSQDKANEARNDANKVRDAEQVIKNDSQFAQNVRDAAAVAAAAALLAANRAADLAYSDGDDDTTRQDVYNAASSALQADAALKTINNPEIQSLYSAASSAAVAASSAANAASGYLPSPTTPASQSSDGGYQDPDGPDSNEPGSAACIRPGSTRVLGWGVRDGSVNSCYPKYDVKSSSASNGRLTLAYTGDGASGFVGFNPDTSTSCKGVYAYGGDDRAITQWAPYCTSGSNGEIIPYLDGTKLVSGLAVYNGITLLAIAAKSQSALDCWAKSIKRGSFVNNAVYKVLPASNCRVGNVPKIPIAALFNLSIPIPGEKMVTRAPLPTGSI